MTLDYITDYIDKKIYTNDRIIKITFYELRIKENLNMAEVDMFVKLSKQRLINLGYNVYETGEKYIYEEKEKVVKSNMIYVAIKKYKNMGDKNEFTK